ncbi:GNAT family N-acetyltransferase [Silicimonas algicola]|uniref:GNAT family acetyltransferase n=1 Tax=Silicimonas algicola TaxID=1826607 RepID=A0A316G9Y6_9RHOB|nr:GNAT family N-acetyltransferase [Silicimonas algicola]AZQ67334.1 GNAT family N-acetyltransferase [Silicimonas algicola]PWK57015.1 GNAT family acetyltransferase [Silicimonas algicola]
MDVVVRSGRAEDVPALPEVFHAAVQAAEAYSEAERAAWSPAVPTVEAWTRRLDGLDVVVAEVGGEVAGFMCLKDDLLDLAYVHPTFARQGVGHALYAVVEGRARSVGVTRLRTEASLVAEPFFLRHGWRVVRRQEVVRNGVALRNAVMEKVLPVPDWQEAAAAPISEASNARAET